MRRCRNPQNDFGVGNGIVRDFAQEVMAMKICLRALVVSIFFFAIGTAAHAQNPYARPTVTPWLNLYRGGNPAALNYYNLVRPEMDFRSSIQQLQQQSGANQQAIADLTNPTSLPVTGTGAGFMTHSIYFQTRGGTGIGGIGSIGVGSIGQEKPTAGLNKPTTGFNKPTSR
jgi:hypothetical protein